MAAIDRDSTTPPHHPTYGVELTDETIYTLLRHVFPHSTTTFTISRLPHGMSYNNKIYIIHSEGTTSGSNQSYVLKVIGRFFGPAKVENEVLSLLLLNHYCPDIPVPVVTAWSRDGTEVTRQNGRGTLTTSSLDIAPGREDVPGWILMTQLPGSTMDCSELSSDEKADLSLQLASIIAKWRQNIPLSTSSANLHLQPYSHQTASRSLYPARTAIGSDLHVYGIVDSGNDVCPPVSSLLEYWQTEFRWRITKLSTKPVFAPNREPLLPLLHKFLDETLPNIPLFQSNRRTKFTFTHTDLFPRNVLTEGSPPKITGIVDFEFSGFFPPMEEFIQEWMPEDDDWPAEMHEMILKELERLGEVTPRNSTFSEDDWKQIMNLNLLKEYIALWWLDESLEENADTTEGLVKSRSEVERAVKVLEQMVTV